MLRMIDNKFVIGTSEDWNKHMTKTDITDQPLLKYVYLNLKLYTYILIYIIMCHMLYDIFTTSDYIITHFVRSIKK